MGAINYGTSDVITLAVKPYDLDDLTPDERAAYIADDYAADYDNAAAIISNYSFDFFRIAPAWGYYEGVYIALSDNFYAASYADKRDALKEATRLKRLLLDLAGVGFVRCAPRLVHRVQRSQGHHNGHTVRYTGAQAADHAF